MEQKTSSGRTNLSYDDVKDIIRLICKNKKSQEYVLIKVNEVQTLLKIKKNKEVSTPTIRSKGISHRGYFEKKYPDACKYKYTGDTNKRGLLVNPEKMLEELEQ